MSANKECHNRRVQAYLKPSINKTFTGYAKTNHMSKSECVNLAVKEFIRKMPESDRAKYDKAANDY